MPTLDVFVSLANQKKHLKSNKNVKNTAIELKWSTLSKNFIIKTCPDFLFILKANLAKGSNHFKK
jgi:hypothetical protein